MTSTAALRVVRSELHTARTRNEGISSAVREILAVQLLSTPLLLPPRCSAETGMYFWRDGAYAHMQDLANATIHDELLASDMIKPLK